MEGDVNNQTMVDINGRERPVRWGSGNIRTNRRFVPRSVYTDPARHEAESNLLRNSWLFGCLEQEIPEAGDTSLFEALGQSVLIVRQKDGSVLAWHNVCQHRGARLACTSQKKVRRFVCPYHAWSFGLDGALTGVPGREYYTKEELADMRTPPVAAAVRHGIVWINMGENPQPIDDIFGEVGEELTGFNLDQMKLIAEPMEFDIPANWKRGLEAFLEDYHAPSLHSPSLPTGNMPGQVDYTLTTHTLFESNSMMVYTPKDTLTELRATLDHFRFGYNHYLIYPCTIMNFMEGPSGVWQVWDFLPVSVNQAKMRMRFLAGPNFQMEHDVRNATVAYLRQVFGEDIFACGEQSATDHSLGNQGSLLGDAECRIAHLYDCLDRDLGIETPGAVPWAK